MKKMKVLLCSAMFLMAFLMAGKASMVTAEASQAKGQEGYSIQLFGNNYEFNDYSVATYQAGGYNRGSIYLSVNIPASLEESMQKNRLKVSAASSNPKMAKIVTDVSFYSFRATGGLSISYEVYRYGTTTLTVKVGSVSEKIKVFILPPFQQQILQSLEQTGSHEIKVAWDKISGCTGYIVQRSAAGKDQFSDIKKVTGSGRASTTVKAEWSVKYDYRVLPYFSYHSQTITVPEPDYTISSGIPPKVSLAIAAEKRGVEISSIEKAGKNQLEISWEKEKDAKKFEIYRASSVEGKYKRAAVIKNNNTTSWKQKVTPAKQYYYYMVTTYSEGRSKPSDVVCGYLPKSVKKKAVSQKGIILDSYAEYGVGNWSSSDTVFYYNSGKKLYTVILSSDRRKLNIYAASPGTLKMKKYKTVKLGKFDVWGGFYQGTDGKFYVALGFNNPDENDSKTVIKVVQYSSKWRKGKVCSIKGNATNVFEGIYEPFEAGNCRMTMQGKTLYVETCRTMYEHADGLHHQSNIAFKINTKTMKYKCATEVYSSHSFNQFAKFSNGDLYVVNHGDAYPRAVNLAIIKKYGTKGQSVAEKDIFPIRGKTGNNYTGLTVGGMEVGIKNVLVAGTSVPQNKKVKGIKGASGSLARNVYLIVADKRTGKPKFKWLTSYNPKTSKVKVGDLRMVKLSSQRFAVLYSVTQGKKQKLNYVVVDDTGEKIYSKTYSGMAFLGSTQPILSGGSIIWMENDTASKKSKDSVKTYRIPAVY